MKKILITMTLIILLLLTACTPGGYTSVKSIENNTPHTFNMKYAKFNGHKERNINLEENTDINVEITSESGELNIKIQDENSNILYQGNDLQECNFVVKVKNDGKYLISVEGHKHKGSFNFTW